MNTNKSLLALLSFGLFLSTACNLDNSSNIESRLAKVEASIYLDAIEHLAEAEAIIQELEDFSPETGEPNPELLTLPAKAFISITAAFNEGAPTEKLGPLVDRINDWYYEGPGVELAQRLAEEREDPEILEGVSSSIRNMNENFFRMKFIELHPALKEHLLIR